ncbi:hypothetical protein QJQ45_011251 [Haematococcus lacustris]|nr:hypothetical protein QJQ45_011251 [Haematococcus lacustris]
MLVRSLRTGYFRASNERSLWRCWTSSCIAELLPGVRLTATKQFSHEEVAQFLSITGDANPLHISKEAAIAAGFPGPLVPGVLLASLFPAIIGSACPGAVYASQSLAFRAPALVSMRVTACVTVERISGRRVSFETQCFSDAQPPTLLLDGRALALLPSQRPVVRSSGKEQADGPST